MRSVRRNSRRAVFDNARSDISHFEWLFPVMVGKRREMDWSNVWHGCIGLEHQSLARGRASLLLIYIEASSFGKPTAADEGAVRSAPAACKRS